MAARARSSSFRRKVSSYISISISISTCYFKERDTTTIGGPSGWVWLRNIWAEELDWNLSASPKRAMLIAYKTRLSSYVFVNYFFHELFFSRIQYNNININLKPFSTALVFSKKNSLFFLMHSPLQTSKKSPVLSYNYNEQRAQTPLQKLKKCQSELGIEKGFGSAILRCICWYHPCRYIVYKVELFKIWSSRTISKSWRRRIQYWSASRRKQSVS